MTGFGPCPCGCGRERRKGMAFATDDCVCPGHILYTNEDADAPRSIKDRNGDVVLDMCKICYAAENEL